MEKTSIPENYMSVTEKNSNTVVVFPGLEKIYFYFLSMYTIIDIIEIR
jgi:hypothetical protein